MVNGPKSPTARAFLDSIIHRCSELQNWSEADLKLNLSQLQEIDDTIHALMTEEELEKLEQEESERMRDEEHDAAIAKRYAERMEPTPPEQPRTIVTEFNKVMLEGQSPLSVTYYLDGLWTIEGGTPSGWVNFELTEGETKDHVQSHLKNCGFSPAQVDEILADF